ncbi:MAG: type II secretion system F family protein [Deltaproteobacteria bacterium]|nr:type II secretion system F family protein [Deltaproteobacteria bacterium]
MEATVFSLELPALVISLGSGLAVLALAAAGYGLILRRDAALRRIEALAGSRQPGVEGGFLSDLVPALGRWLSRLAKPAKPKQEWQISRIRRELLAAGFRSKQALNILLGLKVLTCLALPPLSLLPPLPDRLPGTGLALALVGLAGLGFLLPNLVLSLIHRKRADKIDRELPEALDLLVLAVEAGLGLDAALKRVSLELAVSCPVLAEELAVVSLELKAGIPRDKALKNLADRCGVDDVSNLVTMLTQADRFGVSVGRSLRVHSDTVRTKRRQQLEEKAAKIPLKLLFPILFLIFPAIMAVMIGPALIKVTENIFR